MEKQGAENRFLILQCNKRLEINVTKSIIPLSYQMGKLHNSTPQGWTITVLKFTFFCLPLKLKQENKCSQETFVKIQFGKECFKTSLQTDQSSFSLVWQNNAKKKWDRGRATLRPVNPFQIDAFWRDQARERRSDKNIIPYSHCDPWIFG